MNSLPPLFLSHGSPMTALEPREAGSFWQQLGRTYNELFGRPRAILIVSPHTSARHPLLLGGAQHEAVYDFGGFDPQLNTLRYDAPGAPALAAAAEKRLNAAGIEAQTLNQGGLDHGIWVPLRFMFPEANVPVLPLALQPQLPPSAQWGIGQALSGLADEGVLVIGSGSITHNLRRALAERPAIDAPEAADSAAFRQWFAERSTSARSDDWEALLDYRRQAPFAVAMHPSDEHLLPWFIAAGAGGNQFAAQRLHASLTFGCLGMDAYAFGADAAQLAEHLHRV